MGTYTLVPQIKRSVNFHVTETIVTIKFRGLKLVSRQSRKESVETPVKNNVG